MKKILAALTVTVIAAAAAVPALAGTKSVKIGDNYFVRPANNATVSIQKGSTLKFLWRGHAPHNVVKRSGPGGGFHSPVKTSGSYYKLVCTIHRNMKLIVKVR
jgi:plastocyanin